MTLWLLVTSIPMIAFADDPEIVDYGTCGEAVNWAFDREGTLVISGSGEMQNYSEDSEAPWSYRHLDIKTIEIESGVTSIGDRAFEYCTSLTSTIITIPDSVTSIGNNAFLHCNLTSITIPKSVTSIGVGAFEHCKFLTIITIPDSVTSIGDSTFAYCKSVMRIEIPDSVTSIGEYAFSDCSSLESIEIPNSVTSICDCAFQNCSSLESIEIPNSVTSIGKYAFDSCKNLTIITIPNSVTSIGDHAFRFCSSLTEIMIPDRVESIGLSAFYRCDNLNICANPDTYAATYVIENKEDFKSYHIHNYEDLGWVTTKAATCTDAGKKQRRCQECDFLDTGTIPATGHTFGDWIITLATCTIPGEKKRTCIYGDKTEKKEIPATGHSWNDKPTVDKPATCTETGKQSTHCAVCGTIKEGSTTEIAATGHDWEFTGFTWIEEDNDPNMYTGVAANYKCRNDAKHTETVEALVTPEVTDPTCETAGKTVLIATVSKDASPDGVARKDSRTIPISAEGHDWGEWKVTKEATATEAGEKQRICKNNASHIEKKTIPVKKTEPEPTSEAEPETKPETEPETKPETKPETEPEKKVSGTLLARMTAKGNKSLVLTWSKVKGAEGYDIFFTGCGTTLKNKVVRKIKGNKTFTWTKKKLSKGKKYKAYVKAWVKKDGKKTYVKKSPAVHAFTANGNKKYTNPKSITVKKKKITLKAGKSYTIKTKINKIDEKKSLMKETHGAALRYCSSNTKIARVSSKGKITAKAPGKCKVYVYAINGVSKTIRVTVKEK